MISVGYHNEYFEMKISLNKNCVSAWLIKGCVCGEINTALTAHGVMMESRTMAYLTTVRNIWVSKDEAANNDPVLRLTHNNCILLPLRRKQRAIWRIRRVSYERKQMIYVIFFQHVTTQTFNQKSLLNRLNSY